MNVLSMFFAKYGAAIGSLGAGVAFLWTVIQFLSIRGREAKNREFDNFHRLIRELVEPPTPEGALYVDRQCAILFELRFFPRYYPVINRTLDGLKMKWSGLEGKYERLLDEADITTNYINEHRSRFQRFFRFFYKVDY